MLLESVELNGGLDTVAVDGFLRWEAPEYAVSYPEHYSAMENATGIMFVNPDNPNNVFAVRTYNLEFEYEDYMGPALASRLMPKSANVTAEPETQQIAGRSVAVIRGKVDAGPLAYFLFGEGRTIYVVLLTGEEATGMGEQIIASLEVK